jgi:hypothetical protein
MWRQRLCDWISSTASFARSTYQKLPFWHIFIRNLTFFFVWVLPVV